MLFNDYQLGETINSKKSTFFTLSARTVPNKNELVSANMDFIRFEEKKDKFVWAHPDEIYFVVSADHYVKSLIKCGDQTKWMSRHSTLKELIHILGTTTFMRLNKFYLLNRHHFSHIDEHKKLLYFNDGSSVAIPHRISPFLCHLLKSTYT